MSKSYCVTLTMIYNHSVTVNADNENDAIKYVRQRMDELAPDCDFIFGEKTVDFAELEG